MLTPWLQYLILLGAKQVVPGCEDEVTCNLVEDCMADEKNCFRAIPCDDRNTVYMAQLCEGNDCVYTKDNIPLKPCESDYCTAIQSTDLDTACPSPVMCPTVMLMCDGLYTPVDDNGCIVGCPACPDTPEGNPPPRDDRKPPSPSPPRNDRKSPSPPPPAMTASHPVPLLPAMTASPQPPPPRDDRKSPSPPPPRNDRKSPSPPPPAMTASPPALLPPAMTASPPVPLLPAMTASPQSLSSPR